MQRKIGTSPNKQNKPDTMKLMINPMLTSENNMTDANLSDGDGTPIAAPDSKVVEGEKKAGAVGGEEAGDDEYYDEEAPEFDDKDAKKETRPLV